MKRITVKKGGLWYLSTYFNLNGESLLVSNVTDDNTMRHYGLGYALKQVYKAHDNVIGSL